MTSARPIPSKEENVLISQTHSFWTILPRGFCQFQSTEGVI